MRSWREGERGGRRDAAPPELQCPGDDPCLWHQWPSSYGLGRIEGWPPPTRLLTAASSCGHFTLTGDLLSEDQRLRAIAQTSWFVPCAGVWLCQQEQQPPSCRGASHGGLPLLQAGISRSTQFPTWSSQAGSLWYNLDRHCCWSLSLLARIPKILLLGGNAPDLCLQRRWCLRVCHPMLFRGVWGHQQGSVWHGRLRCHLAPAGSGSGRLLMWSINPGGDRGGQSREAGAVKHCRQRGSVLRGEPRAHY